MNFNLRRFSLIFIFSVILFSCSSDSDPTPEKEERGETIVQDDYQYVALRNDGRLFTIGDQTGEVEDAGRISDLEFNTVFNSVTSSPKNNYIFEAWFDPPQQRLFVRNRTSGNSQMVELEFPEEFGNVPGLMSLDWDASQGNLVGIIREEFDIPSLDKPIKIARIEPDTYEMTILENLDLNVLGYRNVFSSQLIGQRLYVSASKNSNLVDAELLEIDLTEKTLKVLSQESINTGLLNLGRIPETNTLLGFAPQVNTGYAGEVKPYIYDIDNEELDLLETVPRISGIHFAHKTFVNLHSGEMVSLIGKEGYNLFKYDHSNNDFEITPITNPEDLSTMIAIIDVIKL
ncbi:hypothetical protein MKO06_12885 [Gramella sp. GC03-9]|uniref:TolB-like protein n=1 Tax=Christiangramia oceanisediminis TaxID=2920386 RepID=A0A9X2KYP8_9FLAO|nr:hypothetical protein [Gramella oceanisediminis]MCP9200808.1 hypothetical protein [Gramella oceanisediminis]